VQPLRLEGDARLKSCRWACRLTPWRKTLHTAQPAIAGSSRFSAEPVFSVAGLSDICLTMDSRCGQHRATPSGLDRHSNRLRRRRRRKLISMTRLTDAKFLEPAVNGHTDIIVSGDADLLALNPIRDIPIVTPAVFVQGAARQYGPA
jgi:hypothetical protein